jgi:sugar lactone lactonase YvrE
MQIRCLFDGHFKLAEGPVWCPLTQALWWVNMVEPAAVYRMAWGTEAPDVFPAPHPVTGLALARDGFVIVGSVGGLLRLDPSSGAFDPILRLTDDLPGNRCNEIGVDPAGNLWVGTMPDNLSGAAVNPDDGALFRIMPDGTQTCVLRGVGIPNTMVWDAQNRLMTADSLTGVIRRITLSSAGVPERIEHLNTQEDVGVPDGSTLAADGTLWNARWSAGCILGIGPDGTMVRRIEVPGGNITSACFAGPDLKTLIVTSSRWGLTDDLLARNPQAGAMFALEGVGRGTRPQPRFATDIGRWTPIQSN